MKKVIGGKAPFRTALLMVAMFAGTVAPLAVRADEGGDGYGYGGDGGSGSQEYYGEGRYDDEHVPSQRALRPDRNKTPKTTADGARYFRDAADVPDSVQVIGSRPGPARYVRAVVPTPVVDRTPVLQPIAEVFGGDAGSFNQPNDGSDRIDADPGVDVASADPGDAGGDGDSGSDGE